MGTIRNEAVSRPKLIFGSIFIDLLWTASNLNFYSYVVRRAIERPGSNRIMSDNCPEKIPYHRKEESTGTPDLPHSVQIQVFTEHMVKCC